jgi:Fe2+ or Zn2+ uptake regulation protein
MELVYAVNSSYNEVHRNLQILEEEGIVVQNRTLNKRIIFFNTNEKTVDMLKALDVLEQINLSIAKQAKNAEGQQTEVLY